MYHRFEDGVRGRAAAFRWSGFRGCFYTGVATSEDGTGVVRQKGEGGTGVWLLGCRGEGGGVPEEVLAVVKPEVLEVFGLVGSVLEAAKEEDIVLGDHQCSCLSGYVWFSDLVIGHPVATAGRWTFALSFKLRPLSCNGIKPPKVIVVVEGPLLRRGEFSSKEVNPSCISAPTPSVTASGQRRIWASDSPPLISIDVVYK